MIFYYALAADDRCLTYDRIIDEMKSFFVVNPVRDRQKKIFRVDIYTEETDFGKKGIWGVEFKIEDENIDLRNSFLDSALESCPLSEKLVNKLRLGTKILTVQLDDDSDSCFVDAQIELMDRLRHFPLLIVDSYGQSFFDGKDLELSTEKEKTDS